MKQQTEINLIVNVCHVVIRGKQLHASLIFKPLFKQWFGANID